MKRLVLVAVMLAPVHAAHAQAPAIRCPGNNTVEMRYCAEKSVLQSDAQLQRKISRQLFKQWQDATRAVCEKAYAPYKDGTIYPQMIVGCDDNLNRSLLKEFKGLENR
ncbi:lysozyme inhibitor LprI family protein [Vulcanococcus limneticus]|uniref:lysozyme inhibitor LprI family protein n=1 Tax=Vulcanococcus limneticus TaxID=2170428 RepID=UPI000B97DF44|nr:lysozyme inhibitor LprI family protein [Vulcanococcus limneticus]MCP9792638.1 DUF1311 domain-containing protein [Vulcanococcus limneticus MW73D5]MCP9894471.1 DUF1311 domain-containing protein [Vulcanococcus limneticus Candia 3F8]MCP9898044.1 DUF1311 domain-containing protein [Vulcanococcus limneticus Candia 3B3]